MVIDIWQKRALNFLSTDRRPHAGQAVLHTMDCLKASLTAFQRRRR